MVKSLLFSVILFSSLTFFVYSINKVISYLKLGKPENRLNNILQRIKNTFQIAILQSKLFRQKFAGILHLFIYWGFLILLLSVIEGFIEGYIHGFSFMFIGKIYSILTLTQDFFGFFVLISVIISLIRRYFFTPKRLIVEKSSRLDATLILIMIMFVMLTMFGANAERIALQNSSGIRPVSAAIVNIFGIEGNNSYYEIFWWAHNFLVLGFLNYLPYSKHFHVLSSIPNTFFSNYKIDDKNTLKKINFEDDTIEQFGAKDIEDLTWKQLLDGYTCTECGRCTQSCPANITGKLLNPKKIITQVRKRTMQKGPLALNNKNDEETLVHKYITKEELWACTTCGACVEECPVMIDHLTTIVDLRRNLTMMESDFPSELNTVFKNLENNESPWAFSPDQRNDWIKEFTDELTSKGIKNNLVKLSDAGTAENVDIVFWVGCAGAFDKRYRKVTKSFAEIMTKAGITFGVLGNEEKCNGDVARRLGNEFLAQQFINQNIETFKKYNIKKIVTACPHCLHSLKNEYKHFGAELEVHHHTEIISKLIQEEKIKPKKGKQLKYTYHDSCYLGRYNGIYSEPRKILKSLPEIDIIEMNRAYDKGFCCGAGGGRMFMEETEGKRVNTERTEEAINTGANTIASACPFCMTMLTDGIKEKTEEIAVKDIAEIISESI